MGLTQKCSNCGQDKILEGNYIKNINNKTGYDLWCSKCRKKLVIDEQSLKEYCRENNRGYSQDLFKQVLKLAEDKLNKKNKIEKINNFDELLIKSAINLYFSKMNLIGNEGQKIKDKNKSKYNIKVTEQQLTQWGDGFEPFEYQQLENYYTDLLGYFEIENPVHKNLVKLGAMNAVLAEKALREGRIAEYHKLQQAYSSILGDSRLKPSQKNAADGTALATVCQWVEKVELIDGKIPQFEITEPDKIDQEIELYINKMKENLNIVGGA